MNYEQRMLMILIFTWLVAGWHFWAAGVMVLAVGYAWRKDIFNKNKYRNKYE